MILHIYTIIHVVISLVAIVSGFVVLPGWIANKGLQPWTGIFLTTTVATSVTGFFFPYHGFTPALAFGVLSLIVLAVAIYALKQRQLAGGWRKVYLINATFALYLNFFVLIVQSFQKIPALKVLAPTQTEPAFAASQAIALVAFLGLGTAAVMRFRNGK